MGSGIIICGLNGSGKSTLAREVARRLQYRHMDIEDYAFLDSEIPYAVPRPREEYLPVIAEDMKKYDFVFSAVNGDLGEEINAMYACAVLLTAPLDTRLTRVKERAYDLHGDRVRPGGDMYEREQEFFDFVVSRGTEKIEAWLKTLSCPVIYADGSKPIEQNAAMIVEQYARIYAEQTM